MFLTSSKHTAVTRALVAVVFYVYCFILTRVYPALRKVIFEVLPGNSCASLIGDSDSRLSVRQIYLVATSSRFFRIQIRTIDARLNETVFFVFFLALLFIYCFVLRSTPLVTQNLARSCHHHHHHRRIEFVSCRV